MTIPTKEQVGGFVKFKELRKQWLKNLEARMRENLHDEYVEALSGKRKH